MPKDDAEKLLREILSHVQQGNVALFLGAGASHAARGPTGKNLTEMIKEKFPDVDQTLNNFIEVCQDVIDTPPYGRYELEEYVKSVLNSLQPTEAHRRLTMYNWAAIFTTNFDDLIELAYRTTDKRLRPCQPIYSDRFQVNPADRSRTYLFKIMGSVTAAAAESGQMVLSRADYNRALNRRRKYLELLSDFIKTGCLAFIGYSFGDRLVLDVLDELLEIYGKDRLPWSYALFHKLPTLDVKNQYMFSSRKIIPVECSFSDFFRYLAENGEVAPWLDSTANQHIKIRGHTLEITPQNMKLYSQSFDVLTEEKADEPAGGRDQFFMGTNKSWGAFKEDWDFKRDLYGAAFFKREQGGKAFQGSLKDRVAAELREYDPKDNKVLLLTGMAGSGKTTTLRRLAYDVYHGGDAPVIIVDTSRASFDYKLLTSFIEDLNHQFNQKLAQGEPSPPIKPLIIMDDAASLIRHVNRLKDYLASRGRPALIVAADRTGEWDLMWKAFPFVLPDENRYELSEVLSADEKIRIIQHFYNLGYIQAPGVFWEDIIDRTFENSYFATIYSLVHPSRKPLNEIIRDQFQNLTDLTRKAFQHTAMFHQFDLPINLELLVRSLRCTYEHFYNEVVAKDAAKVLFDEHDVNGGIVYRTHHRIIAKKTVEFFFGDPQMQKDLLLDVLREANLSNRREREICEKLLVQHIGPNARPQLFTYEQQRQIFRTVCEKNPLRTLLHHWGVLEADDQRFAEAEVLLKRALETPRDDAEAFRGESDQNILTSLGTLYSRMAADLVKKGESRFADEYFEKAEGCFESAKHGEFPNAYAYHAHAYMWYLRGNHTKNEVESLQYYARALEILATAKDNLNLEELQQIYELETQVWNRIGDEGQVNQCLEVLREKFNSGRGYYLSAEVIWRKAQEEEGEERRKLSAMALSRVEEGLRFFPNDEYCLRLRSKLLKELEPGNLPKYYESLLKWKAAATTPNVWLLYELGRTAFIMEYYDYSKEFFKELETGVGMGHRLRSLARYPILDGKGNRREFEGAVVSVLSSYDGQIKCESLRNLRYPITFRPIACKFTPAVGDNVIFNIEFSYRGPLAQNVRKRA